MITDENKKELIVCRFNQARETHELARFLMDQGKLSVSVNRISQQMLL
jgi:hypothetical protein